MNVLSSENNLMASAPEFNLLHDLQNYTCKIITSGQLTVSNGIILVNIINIMLIVGLMILRAKASAAAILTQFVWDILGPTKYG